MYQSIASFYGSSYMSVPYEESKSTTNISFRIKTYQSDGFIFASIGSIDYCIICIKNGQINVRINLGSGESHLMSNDLKLNDLKWHRIDVQRVDSEISLTIDDYHTFFVDIPGSFYDLNIKYGIYLGGLSDTIKRNYLEELPKFRGCLEQVFYNGLNITDISIKTNGTHDVTDECNNQFEAKHSDDISFVESGSYAVFTGFANNVRTGGTISFQIKTSAFISLVLYNGGSYGHKSDFISIEIINGKIVLSISDGNGFIELLSDIVVSDGFWHSVRLQFSPLYMEISVDDLPANSLRPNLGNKKYFNFSDNLYIGGLDANMDYNGLKSMFEVLSLPESSLKGCLKNVKIGYKMIGLKDAIITKGVKSGQCIWEFPCLSQVKSPCIDGAKCLQQGFHDFKCLCDKPNCFRTNFTHYKYVKIKSESQIYSPINDSPKDLINKTINVLKVAINSKRFITSEYLNVIDDQESRPEEVLYKINGIYNGDQSFIENMRNPDIPIDNFTQSDINEKLICFVHKSKSLVAINNIKTMLTLIDKKGSKIDIIFLVQTYQIELTLINNTGISLPYNTFAIITASNLSYTTNTESDVNQYIRFEITKQSQFGVIEKHRASGHWVNVTFFSQRQINRNKIRYFHLKDKPNHDFIDLQVSYNQIKAPPIQLKIQFKTSQLQLISLNQLTINQSTKQIAITNKDLKFDTSPFPTDPSLIIYTILSLPSFGSLYLINGNTTEKLSVTSFFTQKMIDEEILFYNCSNSKPLSGHDFFDFEVVNEDGLTNVQVMSFHFKFITSTTDVFTLNNEKLIVIEGDRATISNKLLMVETPDKDTLITYNITNKPKFGTIKVLNQQLNDIIQISPDLFTQTEIDDNRVVYYHDDSENNVDVFDFVALDSLNRFICFATFTIDVVMKNDNPPVRVIDKVFQVVTDGEKKLTANDIKYIDADIDSSPANIKYTKTYIPNGNLYFIDRPNVAVEQFTQEDINNENILFKHSGDESGRAILWITDGQFYASGVLEIKASRPFLRILRNTGLAVKYGESVTISINNLTVDSNLDISRKSDVTIKITSEPKFGHILIGGKEINRFTLQDLIDENVEYESKAFEEDSLVIHNDSFMFRLFFNGEDYLSSRVTAENQLFNISIYPHSYFQLSLVHLSNISANEDDYAIVDSNHLMVSHQTLDPENIVFMISELPKLGFLSLLTTNTTPIPMHFHYQNTLNMTYIKNEALLLFTQKDINDGLIHYKYSLLDNDITNNTYIDYFRFDVSNGITTLHDLTLYINIISKIITLYTTNITVTEGQSVVLMTGDFIVSNDFYVNLIDEYLIIEEPKFGTIVCMSENEEKMKTKTFTPKQLKNGLIWYEHNGSETTRDWLTIVVRANSLNKESLPSTIHVSIDPINDETPHVVNNTGLELWEGTSAVLTNTHLAAVDDDSVTEDIVYLISTPSNGYVTTVDNKRTPIERFTQVQIDSGDIMYVHGGEMAGGFRFQVTDGTNFDSPHVFTVAAKQIMISVLVNKKLNVLPQMQQSLTRDHLLVETNDGNSSRQFIYHMIKEPKFGRFLLENSDGSTKQVLSFSQKQINQNFILYEQNKPIDDMIVEDEIIFDVESHFVQSLKSLRFVVEITSNTTSRSEPEVTTQVSIWTDISPITVIEGQFVIITDKNLNTSKLVEKIKHKESIIRVTDKLYARIQRKPSHGVLLYEGHDMTSRIKSLPLSALTKNTLIYKHDNSNTFNDSFVLGIYIRKTVETLIENHTINVNIIPVNDELPILLTSNPRINVIYESKSLITNAILKTSDDDGLPQNIIYELTRESFVSNNFGYFMVEPNEEPVGWFTQTQIDSNKVYFKHNGTLRQQQIKFRVKDEKSVCRDVNESITDTNHCTPIHTMTIVVQQLTLTLTNHSTVQLLQGSIKTKIKPKHLGTISNDIKSEDIIYYIKEGPIDGYIIVNDKTNNEKFTQKDINSLHVSYIQINKTSRDYFIVDIMRDNSKQTHKTIKNITVLISVKPLVKANKPYLIASPGIKSYMTSEHLDASDLASITNSMPKFSVTSYPKFGVLTKFSNELRPKRKTNTNNLLIDFTNEDIVKGKIAYIADNDLDLNYPNEIITDVIHYDLRADSVQTASGVVVVNIVKNNLFDKTNDLNVNRKFNVSHNIDIGIFEREDGVNYLNIIINRDHLLVVIVFIVIVILTITLIVIIKACNSGANHLNQHKNNTKSVPLNTAINPNTSILDTPPASDYGGEMLILSNRLSPRSTPSVSETDTGIIPIVPPTSPSLSTTCSIPEGRTATPRSLLRLPMADRLRGYGLAAQDSLPEETISSVLPLPPPSLYFSSDSNMGSPDNWGNNSIPMSKMPPIMPRYIDDQYCGSYHHLLYPKESLNHNSLDLSPPHVIGNGILSLDSPDISLPKTAINSDDLYLSFNSSNDCLQSPQYFKSLLTYNDCKSPNSDVYINDNFSSDCVSIQHNLGQTVAKQKHQHWV
ncbi:chondroitin sulfate proteoglycan 4-like [Oppia nitens]|uniref:chondroitin sulfate proteoglycan 4-like n=1 Tax=Oppia nitens TaxID=1686743 RepID=UPI0023DABF17|nr:chondroitin sulfate proteoglycan 4-like [Oppia nitens]